jgi:tetratricopeptide (TPR) repeat protein
MTMSRIHAWAMIVVLVNCNGCTRSPRERRDKYVAAGRALIERKDYSRAILFFKNAAQVTPNDAEIYYQMGVAFLEAKDIRSAYAAFRKAVSLNPKHVDAQLKIAQLQARTNDQELLKDTESRLKAILESGSPTADVLNALALTELKLGNLQSAIDSSEQALAQAPDRLFSVAVLAKAKLSLKDVKGAQAILEKATSDAPKSVAARRLLGEFFVGQNRPAEAEAAFRQALVLDPTNGPALMDFALLQAARGRKDQAEQSFKKLSTIEGYKSTYAIFLYQEGRSEAIAEFERLFRKNPNDRKMRTNLIVAYQTTNHSAEADKILENALKKNGKDEDALLQHAEISIEKDQYAPAEADLNRLLQLRPNGPDVHYLMGRLNLARGKLLTYRQELSEALRLSPELLVVRVELMKNLINAKEYGAALDLADSAPASQREAIPLVVQRNWALWGTGNLPEMRKGIDHGLSIAKTTDFLVQDGFWKLRNGNPAGARSALEQALNLNPADLRALKGIRGSYLAEKDAPMALRKAKEFAAEHPKAAPVQWFLGDMLLWSGMKEEARAAFEAAKAAAPNSSGVEMSLVQIDMLEGKLDDANKRLEGILSRDHSNQTAVQWLADIDLMRNRQDSAIKRFREVVSSDPGNAEAYNNLAYLLIEQQPDEALKYAQKAVEIAPDRPAYYDTLGWALYRKGLYAAAVQYLQRAAGDKDKGDAVWTYHLAMAYAKSGDLARGRRTLQAALKQNSNVPEARLAQEVIGQ